MARLLLVDPDLRYTDFCRKELAAAGHTVAVSDGDDALDRVLDFHPEVVILEIVLHSGNGDGLRLMERILARNRRMIVVLNSAYEAYRDNFLTWAADGYVTKSWDLTNLIETISKICASHLSSTVLDNSC